MREALMRSLEPLVQGAGFELVELEFSKGRGGATVRLFIDSPQGVSVDDCAEVSRLVGDALDTQDLIAGRYTLEVSSPGLDRVLRTPQHFERFVGETIAVELKLPQDGRRRFSGRLAGLQGDADAGWAIRMEVDKKDYVLPLAHIHKARLKPH
jgi:ribosome maturation factor RimP